MKIKGFNKLSLKEQIFMALGLIFLITLNISFTAYLIQFSWNTIAGHFEYQFVTFKVSFAISIFVATIGYLFNTTLAIYLILLRGNNCGINTSKTNHRYI